MSFNATGFVRIRFSKPILMPSASSLAEFAEIIMEQEFLQLFLVETESNKFLKGKALFNRTLFEGVQNKTIAKQRLLSEESVAAGNLDGPKQFNWTIAFLEDQYMGIQLQFNDSAFLSMVTPDTLYFNYSQPQQFLVYAFTGVSPDTGFQQLARVPKQLTFEMAVF